MQTKKVTFDTTYLIIINQYQSVLREMALPISYMDPKYNATKKTSLTMKRNDRELQNAPYKVIDEYNNLLFTTCPKFFTFSNRQILVDKCHSTRGNNDIAQFRIKRTSFLQETYYMGTKDELKRFKLNLKEFSVASRFYAMIYFRNDKTISGKILGNWEKMRYDITLRSHKGIAASIFPASPIKVNSFQHKKSIPNASYCIVIEEGVDIAFIVLVVITLEQMFFGQNPI